jgi:hypothetical protein
MRYILYINAYVPKLINEDVCFIGRVFRVFLYQKQSARSSYSFPIIRWHFGILGLVRLLTAPFI